MEGELSAITTIIWQLRLRTSCVNGIENFENLLLIPFELVSLVRVSFEKRGKKLAITCLPCTNGAAKCHCVNKKM